MKIRTMGKRILAVSTGIFMLGATAMGAMAADLSNYPDMFVQDGAFDGYFVVGETASSLDNVALTDIATGMKYMAADGAASVSVEGDAWRAETSGNFLELGENISAVENYLNDEHLSALADGVISNAKGTANYEQFLYFNTSTATTTYQEDSEDNVGYFYKISNAGEIARYTLDFTEQLESDITANVLDDIEDKQITLLGKTYTITTATNTSTTNAPQLILMGGSTSDTILEGATNTYEVNGVEYEVSLMSVSSDGTTNKVQFSVNGESLTKLADGESDVLGDGTNLGVTEITYQSYAGGIHSATFFLGADKVELEHNKALKVNEETISEATVLITATESGSDMSIDDISVIMTADDDFYVGVGQKLSENPEMEEPEVLFTQNWDIELAAVESTGEDYVGLSFSEGDDQADLKVTLVDGEVSISVVFQNASSADEHWGGEDSDERLVLNPAAGITDEDLFFLSTANPTGATNDVKSYLLQYKGADDDGETNPKVRIKNVVTGETFDRSMTNSTGTFDLKLGGTTFNFNNTGAKTSDDYDINLTSGGNTGYTLVNAGVTLGNYSSVAFRTASNNIVKLIQATQANLTAQASDWYVESWVDDTDKLDDSGDGPFTVLNVSIDTASGNDELTSSARTISGTLVTDPEDNDIQTASSNYGETHKATAADSSPTKYEAFIPDSQAEVVLYVTSGATTSATSADGTLTKVEVVVGATKLDNEITDVSAQNLIVVGGPCVNTVAMELLGNPVDCTEGFMAGKARVKLFEDETTGKMAMLVAGYTGPDTRLAGSFISARYGELSGM